MVTVSSAFISSRRERIRFSVLSASGCAFKAAAWVDVLRAVLTLGKTDLDNTDGARDHSFPVSRTPNPAFAVTLHHVGLRVSIRQCSLPRATRLILPPSSFRPGSAR